MTCPRCGAPTGPASTTCPRCHSPLTDVRPDLPSADAGLPATVVDQALAAEAPSGPSASVAQHGAGRLAAVGLATPPPHPPPPTPLHAAAGRHGHGNGHAVHDLIGRQLGPRFQIMKLLGAGGMGAVYQAWDNELGMIVALKTVRPAVADDPDTARMLERRFKQELLLARKVTHRNIVRVHDIGEVDGIKYITMPYLEGEDLATILKREGRLPVPRVMAIARSVSSGLAAAHEAGVVHRDLKPANIMVNRAGEGLVMDFGVARSTDMAAAAATVVGETGSLHGSGPSGRDATTVAGLVVGTIEYMAPEQARAEAVDQRADIYAFGLILYDLLLGRARAERAPSAIAELQQRMREAPPPLRSRAPSVPAALERIVMKCVQPVAADRFATSRDLVAELARLDDNGVAVPVVVARTNRATMGVAAVLIASLLGGVWWWAGRETPPRQHEPVSILITDLQNTTGDAAFDGTLEPMLMLALEGAGFISAYDRNGIRRSLGLTPPDRLDATAGRELAVKHGVGVVLAGGLAREGNGYTMTLRAAESVTGKVIAEESATAGAREEVLAVATTLGNAVRTALGDSTSDSARRFATDALSATSLDVVREYAQAMQSLSNSQFGEARAAFERALDLDPDFGLAYAGLATTAANMGQPQEAVAYVSEAIRHVDRMTERERFRTRGLFYYLTNDYGACVKEYGELLAQYEADVAARNNLALCSTKLRHMQRARDEMARVVAILPKRSLYHLNASFYSTYAGDFATAERQALMAQQLGDRWALQALALARLGQADYGAATAAYEAMAGAPGVGRTYTVSGLADIAVYQGRYADAVRLLTEGAQADLDAHDPDRAAMKLVALSHAELSRGRAREAVAAADRALTHSGSVQVRFLAGRTYAEAGAVPKATALAGQLASELQVEPQAYGKLLEGIVLLDKGDARAAVRTLMEANELLDTWIGHFDLGRAYLAAGAFPQADSEFDRCLKRSGEAISLFLDEEPTSGYLPPVHYYLGRAREGMGTAAYADAYRRYVAIRHQADTDPLAADIRTRLRQ